MTTVVTQVRLPEGLLKEVQKLVERGLYSSQSDVIRDSIRRFVLEQQIGTIENKEDSITQVRKIREKLSKDDINIKHLNSLC